MLWSAMFGDANSASTPLSDDLTLEALLTELLVLSAQVPMDVAFLLSKLTDGLAGMMQPSCVERSMEYANFRIGELHGA
jgi:hypothetical protein